MVAGSGWQRRWLAAAVMGNGRWAVAAGSGIVGRQVGGWQ